MGFVVMSRKPLGSDGITVVGFRFNALALAWGRGWLGDGVYFSSIGFSLKRG
jgi:hypothetical protein